MDATKEYPLGPGYVIFTKGAKMNENMVVFDNILDRAISELLRRLKKCEGCDKKKMESCDIRYYSRKYGMDHFGLCNSELDVSAVYCKCGFGQRTWYIHSGREKNKEEKSSLPKKDTVQQRITFSNYEREERQARKEERTEAAMREEILSGQVEVADG